MVSHPDVILRRSVRILLTIFIYQSTIAEDPRTHGAMLCPVIGGADKTTVSVATGHVEYHPMYVSCWNLSNTMRRSHRETVIPAAFSAIPKGQYST